MRKMDFMNLYRHYLMTYIHEQKLRHIKVVVDAGNGMAGKIFPEIYKNMRLEIVPLFFEMDGEFPNHIPNPAIPENLKWIKKKVVKEKADIGIIFDGDMDRVAFVDEKGKAVSPSVIAAMLAKHFLKGKRAGKMVYAATCGKIFKETIERYGGTAIREHVGHSLVKETMIKNKAVFGAEHNGHYFYQKNHYTDSGMITALLVLGILGKKFEPFSWFLEEFEKYRNVGEISIKVKEEVKDKILRVVEKIYKEKGAKIDKFEGISFEFNDWWFNIRKSGSEPLIRINLEATREKLRKTKLKELLKLIKKVK